MTTTDFPNLQSKIKYLDDHQAAQILGLKPQTLRNWRGQDRGPAYIKAGRAVRYSLDDLIEFANSHKVQPGA